MHMICVRRDIGNAAICRLILDGYAYYELDRLVETENAVLAQNLGYLAVEANL